MDTTEDHRVTNLELFFDLVYVFAFTQVTTLVAHGTAPTSLIEGFVVLSLLWWSWTSYAWLANQAQADEGLLQRAFILAMVAVFFVCLALPDAFHDGSGSVSGAVVLVVCYAVVRLAHNSTYLVAARHEPGLRRQLVVTVLVAFAPTVVLLAIGAAVGRPAQLWIWLAAVLYDFAAVFVTSVTTDGWTIPSAAHFAERHGLVVILALGESVVDIAVGLEGKPFDVHVGVGSALSILVAVGLWFAYFRRLAAGLEDALAAVEGRLRGRLGRDVFTYLHFPIIVGIIVTATGVETATAHLDDDHLGALGGWSLGGGAALFLAGTVAAARRATGARLRARLVAIALLLVASPLLAVARPLPGIGVVAAVLLALAAVEGTVGSTAAPA